MNWKKKSEKSEKKVVMVVQYDDFAETFGASRKNLLWQEISLILDNFTENFSEREIWKIADIGCGS